MNMPSQRCFVWCAERKGALPASPVSTVWAPSSTQPKGWTDAMYKGVGDTEAEALADLRTDLLKWDAEHIEEGDKVESVGLIAEDSDSGRVVEIREDGMLIVAWDSGVRTEASAKDVRVVPHGYQSRYGSDRGLPTYGGAS